ncbi:MAG: helix-turn-helix transcriptional regulator [Bacteroidales bacterium]|nr:helix-turn-helix transcriptional regulator [Bacteroidales bacterium]
MTENEIAQILRAIAVDSRMQIIKLIRERQYCVNAIAGKLGISQSAVSQHLKVLKECDLVFAERYGSIIHYRLNSNRIQDFLSLLTESINHPEDDR